MSCAAFCSFAASATTSTLIHREPAVYFCVMSASVLINKRKCYGAYDTIMQNGYVWHMLVRAT